MRFSPGRLVKIKNSGRIYTHILTVPYKKEWLLLNNLPENLVNRISDQIYDCFVSNGELGISYYKIRHPGFYGEKFNVRHGESIVLNLVFMLKSMRFGIFDSMALSPIN